MKFTRKPKSKLVRKVDHLAKIVKMNAPDKKFFDFSVNVGVTSSGDVLNLFQNTGASSFIVQGTDVQDRIGDSIRPIKTIIRGNIFNSSTDVSNHIRLILVRDISTSGVFPALGDLLNLGIGVSLVDPSYANYNTQTVPSRFKILYDKNFSTSLNGRNTVSFKISKKLGQRSTYSANTGAITDLQDNQYWLFQVSDSTVAPNPTITWTSQTLYHDD